MTPAGAVKIKNVVCPKFDVGQVLSVAAQMLFFWTTLDLVKPLLGMPPDGDMASCRAALQIAGWLASMGWILQRYTAKQWPFRTPTGQPLDREILVPALLLTAALAALVLVLISTLSALVSPV